VPYCLSCLFSAANSDLPKMGLRRLMRQPSRRCQGWQSSDRHFQTWHSTSRPPSSIRVTRCPRRERSAHVGASPPLSRRLGCGGGGTPPKGLWPPAEPPTPCVPRVYDCALFFSALHLASEVGGLEVWRSWRWRSVRAYSVLGST
jgi:hypothetical protein